VIAVLIKTAFGNFFGSLPAIIRSPTGLAYFNCGFFPPLFKHGFSRSKFANFLKKLSERPDRYSVSYCRPGPPIGLDSSCSELGLGANTSDLKGEGSHTCPVSLRG
jgi:hypothetical protein